MPKLRVINVSSALVTLSFCLIVIAVSFLVP